MDHKVLSELQELKKLIQEQSLLKKKVLSFDEAMVYLGVTKWYLYKLTSKNTVPCYKPNGGKLYFKRKELQNWMLSKRQSTISEMKEAVNQLTIKAGIKSDCKSLDPVPAVTQLSLKTGRN